MLLPCICKFFTLTPAEFCYTIHTMKRLFRLAVAVLLLSSCTSQTYLYFYDKGREGSYLKNADCQFWQAGDTLYVEGKLYSYQHKETDFFGLGGFPASRTRYNVQGTEPRTVYGEITVQKNEQGITTWARKDTPWLTQKPGGAVPVKANYFYHQGPDMPLYNRTGEHKETVIEAEPAHASLHALYAYPLAGLSLLAVDIPAMAISNTTFLTVYLLTAPIRLLRKDTQQQEH